MVSQALSTPPSLDLSAFSPNGEVLHYIVSRLRGVNSVTIDCLHLDECSIVSILGPHMQELNLLRALVLELAEESSPEYFGRNLMQMLQKFLCLEHLSIKVRGPEHDACGLTSIDRFLPQTLKYLKLQPVNEQDAISFIEKLRDDKEIQRKLMLGFKCWLQGGLVELLSFKNSISATVCDFLLDK